MKRVATWSGLLGVGVVVLAGLAGCADRNKNGEPDSAANSGEVNNAVGNAGQAAGNVANAASNEVKGAANAVSDAAKTVNTPKIKAALGANAALHGSDINVDTNGAANTINLTGTVTSAQQKNAAKSIAAREAGAGYTINDSGLKVVAGSGGKSAGGKMAPAKKH